MQAITRLHEQYRGTVHLFIGTGRSLCEITFIPFTIDYNHDTKYHGKTETILNYKCTFGLIEGKSTSVTHERVQISVNTTGVLFIYL